MESPTSRARLTSATAASFFGRAGVQPLAAGDEPGALGPACGVDGVGEVLDLGAVVGLAVGA